MYVFPWKVTIEEMNKVRSYRAYKKQKSQLELELQLFLGSMPTCPKTVHSVSLHKVLYFLVWKDVKGRTLVRVDQCPLVGELGRHPCSCPTRFSAGSLDSLIDKL